MIGRSRIPIWCLHLTLRCCIEMTPSCIHCPNANDTEHLVSLWQHYLLLCFCNHQEISNRISSRTHKSIRKTQRVYRLFFLRTGIDVLRTHQMTANVVSCRAYRQSSQHEQNSWGWNVVYFILSSRPLDPCWSWPCNSRYILPASSKYFCLSSLLHRWIMLSVMR